jgi:hypothetical protein
MMQIAGMMFHVPKSLPLVFLEAVKGHSGCDWDDAVFAYDAPPAMCIHLVRYCCDKDHTVETHHIVSFSGGLKINVVSVHDPIRQIPERATYMASSFAAGLRLRNRVV